MSVKTIRPRGNLGAAQTERNRSAGVWDDFMYHSVKDGEFLGTVIEWDFTSLPKTPPTTEGNFGDWTAFTDTGGFINAGTGTGGEVVFGAAADNAGASIRSRATPFRLVRTAQPFYYEARVKSSAIADNKNGYFLGLTSDTAFTAISPLTAAGALADIPLVGFWKDETRGGQIQAVYKASGVTAVTVASNILTTALVADTYVKLGMKFAPLADGSIQDPNNAGGGRFVLGFYVNGLRVATKQIPVAAGTDFPNTVSMGPCFAVLNATATVPGDNSLDWIYAAQMF